MLRSAWSDSNPIFYTNVTQIWFFPFFIFPVWWFSDRSESRSYVVLDRIYKCDTWSCDSNENVPIGIHPEQNRKWVFAKTCIDCSKRTSARTMMWFNPHGTQKAYKCAHVCRFRVRDRRVQERRVRERGVREKSCVIMDVNNAKILLLYANVALLNASAHAQWVGCRKAVSAKSYTILLFPICPVRSRSKRHFSA